MSLTAISSLEMAREKFFMNSTYIMSRKQESNVLWAQEAEMSSGGRNESNSHQLARIGERKIFHELDVHHVQTVGIKRFPAQEAEMSLTAMSSLESARRKFFMNSTYIMSKKVGIKRFWAQEGEISSGGRNESNSHQLARIGERENCFMNWTFIMSRKQESNVFGLRRPK